MQKLMVVLMPAGSSVAFGQATASVEQTVTQMERDWAQVGTSKADIDKDLKTMDRIMADDWIGLDFQGNTNSKVQAIAHLKDGSSTTQSVVFGITAIVTGSDTEKSTYKGKDSSGKYVWTDIFVNRNGRWQAVSSESTKVEK